MERFIDVSPGVRLWAQEVGPADASPMLLVMGADAGGSAWPGTLVTALARQHRVIRYDHRDTGRSTRAFDRQPYALADLADDARAVLDAFAVERAHVVGMSLGATLAQLLMLDHPDRLHTATLLCAAALEREPGDQPDGHDPQPAIGPDPRLLEIWRLQSQARGRAEEIALRVEQWRVLNGPVLPFNAETFRRLEQQRIARADHRGHRGAHALAAQTGLQRGAELAGIRTPVLVVEAPEDPLYPPPHARRLAEAIPGAALASIPGMGHVLNPAILPSLAEAILAHTAVPDPFGPRSSLSRRRDGDG